MWYESSVTDQINMLGVRINQLESRINELESNVPTSGKVCHRNKHKISKIIIDFRKSDEHWVIDTEYKKDDVYMHYVTVHTCEKHITDNLLIHMMMLDRSINKEKSL